MIKLDSLRKYDILYKNYINQFSKSYIKGSPIYVGDSLLNTNIKKMEYIKNIIKQYKNIFIDLYMNNNKIYVMLNEENNCIICLEELNEEIMDVCTNCNVKCHIKCLYEWYKNNNNKEMCPICLKTDKYYLNGQEDNDEEEDNEEEGEINQNNQINQINNRRQQELVELVDRRKQFLCMLCSTIICMSTMFILNIIHFR